MAYRTPETAVPPHQRGIARYPWHEWTDGSWWVIEQGTDFSLSINSMRSTLYLRATQENKALDIRFDPGPVTDRRRIYFRFTPKTGT